MKTSNCPSGIDTDGRLPEGVKAYAVFVCIETRYNTVLIADSEEAARELAFAEYAAAPLSDRSVSSTVTVYEESNPFKEDE